LVLVQASLAFSLLEALLSQPPLMPVKKKSSLLRPAHPDQY